MVTSKKGQLYFQTAAEQAQEEYGHVPLFLQYALLKEIHTWAQMERRTLQREMSDEEIESLWGNCRQGLSLLDDQAILSGQWGMRPSHRALYLRLKHGLPLDFLPLARENDFVFSVGSCDLVRLSECAAKWEFLHIRDDSLVVEGYAGFLALGQERLEEMETLVSVNGQRYVVCNRQPLDTSRVVGSESMGEEIFSALSFKFEMGELFRYDRISLRLYTRYKGVITKRKMVLKGKHLPVTDKFPHAYARIGDWLVAAGDDVLELRRTNLWRHTAREAALWGDFLKSSYPGRGAAIACRSVYWLLRPLMPKDIWLISDRINKADDNGEAFFRYLAREGKDGHAYFVLHSKSRDFGRLRGIGKVLPYRSARHRLMHLWAERIISSHASAEVMDPFMPNGCFYWDILRQKEEIFLQHGVIYNDLSKWLNRYSKNIGMFFVSAGRERDSLLESRYFYDKEVVKLTGLPRHDLLEDHPQNIVSIMPTWRKYLVDDRHYYLDGLNIRGPKAAASPYVKFYDSLINHPALLEVARKLGYRVNFMLHPSVMPLLPLFHQSPGVDFCTWADSYRKVFAESNLVVTDYSSAVFDFAYLRKPLVYCQFDKEDFYRRHRYDKGYFDYERDGFGEVEYDLEGTVRRIIEYMENGCCLKEQYMQRIEAFFAFHDRNNCQRVYEAIKA